MPTKADIKIIRNELEKIEMKLEKSYITNINRYHIEELEEIMLRVLEIVGHKEFHRYVESLNNIAIEQDNIERFLNMAEEY